MIFRVTCVVAAVLPRLHADLALCFSLGSIVPDLILGPRCDSAAVQRAVMRSRADGVALVDLSRAEWFTPFGLVSVLAFIDRQCRDGLLVAFVPPADRNKAGYLNRMRLGDRLDELGVAHTLPFVPSRNNSNLMELHSFDSVSSMERLAQHIHDSVAPTDGKYARALYRSLSEAGENVELHSGLSNGFLAAQRTRDWGSTPTLRFAVADSGRGFLENLRPFGAQSYGEALQMALGGVSSVPGSGRRGGLKVLSGLLAGLGGTIVVSSGASMVSKDAKSSAVRSFAEPFAGSVFEGVVPLFDGAR